MDEDRPTPAWFWPTFLVGMAFVVVLIGTSAVAGTSLLALCVAEGGRSASALHATRPTVYAPPPVVPPSYAPPYAPPPAAPDVLHGTIAIEVRVREHHGRTPVRDGDVCELSLTFEGAAEGDGECHGALTCSGDRVVWSASEDQAFACQVRTDRQTIVAHDVPDDGRPSLTIGARGTSATVSVLGASRRARFFVLAESE